MLRPLKLPEDFRVGVDLIFRGFQDAPADKKEVAVDALRSLKSVWPLIQVGRLISPALRDMFRGFIWEEDSKPVGLVTFDRAGTIERWEIGIIVVLPEYRRRGIARHLMNAAIDYIRERGGKVVVLDAAAESIPACLLYQQMGFEHIFTAIEFNHVHELAVGSTLPEGFTLVPLKVTDWRTRYELEQRTAQTHITRLDPPQKASFRTPWMMQIFQSLFWKMSGQKAGKLALVSQEVLVVGWGSYLARLRSGGVNYVTIRMDPKYGEVTLFFESHLLQLIQNISAGRRIMYSIPDWQSPLIEASLALGSTERTRYHRMGLLL